MDPYDPTRFAGIYDIAADLRGGFYVGEPSHPPRRVAHFGRDGEIIDEWFGGMSFYVGGTFDPDDPTRFIGIAPEGTVNVYRGGQLFLYHRVIPGVESSIHPDKVYGDMAHRFLPGLLPGMLGIFIACLPAGVMSSCDSFMIASSALFTENIYRVVSPQKSEKHYIWVGRAVSLLVVIAGVAVAYALPGVIPGLKIWYKVVPMMGIAFWMGLLWRGATPAGAWASALGGFAAWWLVNCGFFVEWVQSLSVAEPLRLVVEKNDVATIYEPWQIVSYLGTGLLAGMVVSLFTRPIEEDRLDRYYALTRTPIAPDEQLEKPCTLPANVQPVSRPMLVSCCGLEIPRPSATSILGFFLGWLCVAALIGGFVWLLS